MGDLRREETQAACDLACARGQCATPERHREAEPKTIRLRFSNVGRAKKTWEATFIDGPGLSYQIMKSIRSNGGLASRDIEFTLNVADGVGFIQAGFHTVGDIDVIPDAPGAP